MSVTVVGWLGCWPTRRPLLPGVGTVIARAWPLIAACGIALARSRWSVAVLIALTGPARTASSRLWTDGWTIACGRTGWTRRWTVLHRRPRRRTLNRARRWTVGHRTAVPATAVAVERSILIITAPVATDNEADDRYADLCAVGRHQHALILIVVLQVIASNPAAVAESDDIAPFPAVCASLDG